MGWIQTDYNFSWPLIRLIITHRTAEDCLARGFSELCQRLESRNIVTVAALVQSIVDQSTDIQGVAVIGMNFDFDRGSWSWLLSHPSFPRASESNTIPVVYLDTDDEGWILRSVDNEKQLERMVWKKK